MKKVLRSGLVLSLLLLVLSCRRDPLLSPRKQATADQELIQKYMRTHTYAQGAIREIGETVFGKKVEGKAFSESAVKLPSGIWIWTRRKGLGAKPTATSRILLHYQGIALTRDGTSELPDSRDKTGQSLPGSTLNGGTGRPLWIELTNQAEPWWAVVMPYYGADDEKTETDYAAQGVAFIPSAQGFGDRLIQGLPRRAVLVYEFEIYTVEKAAQ